MLASLPMYDFPEWQEANASWWQTIASLAGYDSSTIPLVRGADYQQAWHNPALIFSQTCGYPFTHEWRDKFKLIGTPHYAVAGCESYRYSSWIVSHQDRLLGKGKDILKARVCLNGWDSMSGMLALQWYMVKQTGLSSQSLAPYFQSWQVSGGHLASLTMLQNNQADLAAIDVVTWDYAKHYRPSLVKGMISIAQSPMIAGLPYVTRQGNVQQLQAAIKAALREESLAPVRAQLRICGFSETSWQDYQAILNLEQSLTGDS